ncbi:MAG: OmpA family protein [Treponema sp.]|nr:OmpA family protein [Treponema sp.]
MKKNTMSFRRGLYSALIAGLLTAVPAAAQTSVVTDGGAINSAEGAFNSAGGAMLRSSVQNPEQYDRTGGPVKFEFKFKEGDKSRILSHVDEDVYVNRRFNRHSVILNRIAMEVTAAGEDGSGTQEGTFMTSENAATRPGGPSTFVWGEEYESKFVRSRLGVYTISDIYFMPTVRDVPVFPDREVSPGESWTAQGHEAHDLRRQFAVRTPYKVPFEATYTYLGTVTAEAKAAVDGGADSAAGAGTATKTLHVINVKYTMSMETPEPAGMQYYMDYPLAMMGYSDELVYWDNELGAIDHYTENFRILMESSYGNVYEFRGTADAEVTSFERVATEEKIADVEEQIKNLGIDDITVKKTDKGLTISIENIQFGGESAVLLNSEKIKLRKIAGILRDYPDNDILVSGHTAHYPGGADPQVLSEERAAAVADFLVELGVKDKYHVFTQGFGDKQPIDTNDTAEGRAKNRRVEITIMDE